MSPSRAYEWLNRRPLLVDSVIAGALLLCLALPVVLSMGLVEAVPLSVAMVGVLAFRRRQPELVALVVTAACLAQLAVMDSPLPGDVAVPAAVYAVAAYGRWTWARRGVLALGVLGAVLASVDWARGAYGGAPRWTELLFGFLLMALLVAGSWVLGDLMRSRRAVVAQLREQNLLLQRDRDQRARLAAQQERARIARDMHDVVAHSLSVIVVQADGGAYAARHAAALAPAGGPAPAEDPRLCRAATTLETVAETARQALAETRRLVGVLREDDAEAELAPQEGLADLEALTDRVRGSGVDVALEVSGPERELPRGVELTAYRVVQEALTNVLKHAGPDVSARVRLDYLTSAVQVRVEDDGRGASAPDDGDGHGLVGMAERVAVYGGSLHAGPRPGGGFALSARIPTADGAGGHR